MTNNPVLSVLIPAFQNIAGVIRILEQVPLSLHHEDYLEVVVSDDSPDFSVGKRILSCNEFHFVKVVRGPQQGGAANWNHLLNLSNGQFVQFIHHDECPDSPDFFKNLVSNILFNPAVYFHKSVQIRWYGSFVHCKTSISIFMLRVMPSYYLRRNILGSPSNFCVPRSGVQYFDEDLVYLVDVEWYSRFSKDLQWLSSGLNMLSYSNPNSITNDLRSQGLRDVRKSEQDRHNNLVPKLSFLVIFLDIVYFIQKAANVVSIIFRQTR